MEEQNSLTGQTPEISEAVPTGTVQQPKRRFTDNLIFYCLTAFLLIFVGQILGTVIVFLPIRIWRFEFSSLTITLLNYLLFIGIWITTLLWFCRRPNRPLFRTLGTAESGNTVPMFLLGLLIGAATNGLCILAAWLHGDIFLYYDSFRLLPLLLTFLSVLVQSSAEELVCRAYLYRKLLNRYNPTAAILVSSLFFSLLHITNSGVGVVALLDIFVSGLLFALLVYYFNSIWCAFAAHTAWNYTQNIIFGLPNSGMVVPFSILKLDASTASDSFFYNVGFGVEGTVFAILVEVAACVLVVLWARHRQTGRKP